MTRAPIPKQTQEEVLTRSGRRCAFCFGLDGSFARKKGQIAHIDRDHTNAAFENLAYLCLEHHDEYDSKTSQSKGLVRGELIHYRDRLYALIAKGEHHRGAGSPPRSPALSKEVISHDRTIFYRANEVLDESTLRDVLDRLIECRHFTRWKVLPIERMIDHLALESNKFVIDDLEAVADDLRESLTKLYEFFDEHFDVCPEDQEIDDADDGLRTYLLHQEWAPSEGGKPEDRERYEGAERELDAAVESVRTAMSEYRRTVKRTLLV